MLNSKSFLFVLLAAALFSHCGSDQNSCGDDCDSSIGEECIQGDCKCALWDVRTVTFQVHEGCYSGLSLDDCLGAVSAGFDGWNDCACSDFEVVLGGTTTATQGSHDPENPENSVNLIMFHEDWQHEDSAFLMLTISHEGSGRPYGADIEFNAEDFVFDRGSIEQNVYDAVSRVLRVEDCDDMCVKYPTGQASSCGY